MLTQGRELKLFVVPWRCFLGKKALSCRGRAQRLVHGLSVYVVQNVKYDSSSSFFILTIRTHHSLMNGTAYCQYIYSPSNAVGVLGGF